MILLRTLAAATLLTAAAACTPPNGAANTQDGDGTTTIAAGPDQAGKPGSGGDTQPNVIDRGSRGPAPVRAGPCDLQSIVGVWSLAHIEAAEPGVQETYRQAPYEFTRIDPDGSVIYFATNRMLPNVETVVSNLDLAQRQAGMTFRVDMRPGGVYVLLRDGQPFQAVRCTITDQAGRGGAQPGDMIWTNLDGMPSLYRVQRRVR